MKPVEWSIDGGIGFLSLCRPPGNLMDPEFFDELHRLTREVVPRSGVSAIVVRGSGRHFSAGADLKSLIEELAREAGGGADFPARLARNLESFEFLDNFPGPVVAAIQGACLGSGLELALACGTRIAAPNAVFGLPEGTFGLIPGCGGLQRLVETAGRPAAAGIALSGATFGAGRAMELGVIDAVVPAHEILRTAIARAGRGGSRKP